MRNLKNEQQLFYSKDGVDWEASTDGVRWGDDRCAGYLHKHIAWDEFQSITNPKEVNESREASVEYYWSKSELEWCDSMLRYINRGDSARAGSLTKEQIDTYAIALCDYTTVKGGVYSIRTDKPARPVAE